MRNKKLILKFGTSLVIAHFIIVIGRDDWLSVFLDYLYYEDLIITFFSVFIVFEYIDRITMFLDNNFGWRKNFILRTIRQLGLAVIIPSLFAVLLTYLQFEFIYDQNLFDSGYFATEFPASVLLIIIINLVYVISYIMKNPERIEGQMNADKIVLGKKGTKNIPVKLKDIAFLKLRNEILFLTTFVGEEIILSENLDYYQKHLPETDFFRTNRQSIISRSACKSFAAIENGKVEVLLVPETPTNVIVSQKSAARFRSWIKG